jgi:hypothetical protein
MILWKKGYAFFIRSRQWLPNPPSQTMDILSRIPLGVASPLFNYRLALLTLTYKTSSRIFISQRRLLGNSLLNLWCEEGAS